MNQQRLRATIERLHAEIDRLQEIDDPSKKRLEALVNDISKLDGRDHDADTTRHLADRLQDEISRLEATHPSLTMALAEIVDILTAAGI
jgi:prefoldin subunit 5